MSHPGRTLRALWDSLGLNVSRCPVCGRIVHRTTSSRVPVCPDCAATLRPRTGGFCPACGTMSGREQDPPSLCPECRRQPPPWENLYFHGHYAGVLRRLILSCKFGRNLGHNRLLQELARVAFEQRTGPTPDLIIPVPLHRRRLIWRGFNQSLELANGLSRAIHRPVDSQALTRTRHTVPQTRLKRRQRLENIQNAFAARADKVAGQVVLLVDDIYTTGSTLRECALTLKRAGAAGVDVLVLARAQQEPHVLPAG